MFVFNINCPSDKTEVSTCQSKSGVEFDCIIVSRFTDMLIKGFCLYNLIYARSEQCPVGGVCIKCYIYDSELHASVFRTDRNRDDKTVPIQ